MGKVLIIGAGGVGTVVANKVAQNNDVFTEIMLASRTKSKCDAIAEDVRRRTGVTITTAKLMQTKCQNWLHYLMSLNQR